MLRVHRDRTGDVTRLKCDACGRVSPFFFVGPVVNYLAVRDWLRRVCGECGWVNNPSRELGQAVRIDFCGRCCGKPKRIL